MLNSPFLKALMLDCIVHDVPFPAYETFEDRKNLPRRFFLFFDKFFGAGRHNKGLWNAAIDQNQGRNNISFGTCIFEAHVRTTIQENYFTWIYEALASTKVIQVLDKAEDFKTEYDFDKLPDNLACGCPFISDLEVVCPPPRNRKIEISKYPLPKKTWIFWLTAVGGKVEVTTQRKSKLSCRT